MGTLERNLHITVWRSSALATAYAKLRHTKLQKETTFCQVVVSILGIFCASKENVNSKYHLHLTNSITYLGCKKQPPKENIQNVIVNNR